MTAEVDVVGGLVQTCISPRPERHNLTENGEKYAGEAPSEIAAIVGEIDFDPDALLDKYLAERDKRLREGWVRQYVEVSRVLPLCGRPLMSSRGSPMRR